MKLHTLFESTLSDEAVNDLDFFFASPQMNLKDATIAELKKLHPPTGKVKLYRVLFSYDEDKTADLLGVSELVEGKMATHKAQRVSSWSTSFNAVEDMAEESDDLGDLYIILEAEIPRANVVIDTTLLSDVDLLAIRGNRHLVQLIREQKEVIVEAGSYPCKMLSVVRY